MPSNEQSKESEQVSDVPVVLSEGAAVALGNTLARFVPPSSHESKQSKAGNKRPRSERKPIVLVDNEDVQKQLEEGREEKRRYKELRQKKLKFESNARVIPDAATGAALERKLLETATKGTVALFNAVAKAQKAVEDSSRKKKKEKGQPVSRENFMSMMKAGVSKSTVLPTGPKTRKDNESSNGSDDDAEKTARSNAKWLKEDFLTSGGKQLQDWDKAEQAAESSDEEDMDADMPGDDVDHDVEQDESEDEDLGDDSAVETDGET